MARPARSPVTPLTVNGNVRDLLDLSRSPRPCTKCKRAFQPTTRRRLLCATCFGNARPSGVEYGLSLTGSGGRGGAGPDG